MSSGYRDEGWEGGSRTHASATATAAAVDLASPYQSNILTHTSVSTPSASSSLPSSPTSWTGRLSLCATLQRATNELQSFANALTTLHSGVPEVVTYCVGGRLFALHRSLIAKDPGSLLFLLANDHYPVPVHEAYLLSCALSLANSTCAQRICGAEHHTCPDANNSCKNRHSSNSRNDGATTTAAANHHAGRVNTMRSTGVSSIGNQADVQPSNHSRVAGMRTPVDAIHDEESTGHRGTDRENAVGRTCDLSTHKLSCSTSATPLGSRCVAPIEIPHRDPDAFGRLANMLRGYRHVITPDWFDACFAEMQYYGLHSTWQTYYPPREASYQLRCPIQGNRLHSDMICAFASHAFSAGEHRIAFAVSQVERVAVGAILLEDESIQTTDVLHGMSGTALYWNDGKVTTNFDLLRTTDTGCPYPSPVVVRVALDIDEGLICWTLNDDCCVCVQRLPTRRPFAFFVVVARGSQISIVP